MESIPKLTDAQSELGRNINQLYDNFKKEKIERRTAENTTKYQVTLNDLISQFKKNHQELELVKELQPDHAYFKQAYHKQVDAVCNEFQQKIGQRLKETSQEKQSKEAPQPFINTSQAETSKTIRLHSATIKALSRFLDSIEEEFNVPQSKAYFTQKLKSVNEYWEQILSLHREAVADSLDTEQLQEQYRQIEDRYQSVAIQLQDRLDQQSNTNNNNMNVKLPKITLPTFDGAYTKWKPFMDLFIRLIHNQPISSAEKMYYLKAHLTGEPSKLIRHLQATEESYNIAWKILTDRFNNPRSLVTALLNELLSQPALTVESNAGIKRIHDTSKECLLSLQNLGIKVNEWNPILLHILLQKLDKESRRLYEQSLKFPRELQRVDDFFKFLETRFHECRAQKTYNVDVSNYGSTLPRL